MVKKSAHRAEPVVVEVSDLEPLGLSTASMYRFARKLGAVRVGRRMLIPVGMLRIALGEELSGAIERFAARRISESLNS